MLYRARRTPPFCINTHAHHSYGRNAHIYSSKFISEAPDQRKDTSYTLLWKSTKLKKKVRTALTSTAKRASAVQCINKALSHMTTPCITFFIKYKKKKISCAHTAAGNTEVRYCLRLKRTFYFCLWHCPRETFQNRLCQNHKNIKIRAEVFVFPWIGLLTFIWLVFLSYETEMITGSYLYSQLKTELGLLKHFCKNKKWI